MNGTLLEHINITVRDVDRSTRFLLAALPLLCSILPAQTFQLVLCDTPVGSGSFQPIERFVVGGTNGPLTAIPSIPAALGNIFLPIQLGTKDVAFPKLNLLSLYIYVFGACFGIYSMVHGGVDTGWTFYTPYSTTSQSSVISMTLAVFILGFSSIFTGLNFIATTHSLRAPGMTFFRMPLFVWALYATSVIQVLATPVLAITLLLLIAERALHVGIFDPALGGDPVLFQHFFWFYSHPAVYIMILPGFGIISELITVHSRKHIFGYKAIALSSVAIAVISFLVWGHHLFVSGQSELVGILFSFLTFAVGVPTAIKVFSWIATLYRGSIVYNTAMWYAMAFLWTFSVGGLTGLPLSTLAIDVHLHDTYFVVAHFHYVMVGGTVVAFIGGIHHWWPKITGKMFNETAGKIGCLMVFVGFNVTFLAKAPLFRMPVLGWILKGLDALPVFRKQDGAGDTTKND